MKFVDRWSGRFEDLHLRQQLRVDWTDRATAILNSLPGRRDARGKLIGEVSNTAPLMVVHARGSTPGSLENN